MWRSTPFPSVITAHCTFCVTYILARGRSFYDVANVRLLTAIAATIAAELAFEGEMRAIAMHQLRVALQQHRPVDAQDEPRD